MKSKISVFVPTAFCAFFCATALWGPSQRVLLSFLPMCFFFVAADMLRMRTEIAELRAALKVSARVP